MRSQNENDLVWNGTSYRTMLSSFDTAGTMAIVDSTTPAGEGPPRHVHSKEDEVFIILSGEIEIWIEGNTSRYGPGQAAFIGKGQEHTFRVCSDTPSRHLIIVTPGGFEEFFQTMAAEQLEIPSDMAKISEIAERHNMAFTGPPLGNELS